MYPAGTFVVAKTPVRLPAIVTNWNRSAVLGTKAPGAVMFTVPPSVALPPIASRSNWVPGSVPSISMARLAAGPWV